MAYQGHCCRCTSGVGDEAKVQPTIVDGEVYCPRCFVTRRMREEPERFNATQACAAQCTRCGWQSVSFGALPGARLRCGHCLRFQALAVDLESLPLTPAEQSAIEELARTAGIREPHRLSKARPRAGG
jgi:late competence protein required for DNA uptake (superfamily II DNA/RNA helicase)